eukprot:8151931-Pyramimonas_sp.AAC.1
MFISEVLCAMHKPLLNPTEPLLNPNKVLLHPLFLRFARGASDVHSREGVRGLAGPRGTGHQGGKQRVSEATSEGKLTAPEGEFIAPERLIAFLSANAKGRAACLKP